MFKIYFLEDAAAAFLPIFLVGVFLGLLASFTFEARVFFFGVVELLPPAFLEAAGA